MKRLTLALASAPLLLVACGESSRHEEESTTVSGTSEAKQLRDAMEDAGITATTPAPEVSDELVALGQALFFDKLLSGDQTVSCATCHLPGQATGDGRNLSSGVEGFGFGPDRHGGVMNPRNSPPLFGLHMRRALFWDGRVALADELGRHLELPPAVELNSSERSKFEPGLQAMAAQAMLPPVSREEMRGMDGSSENELSALGDAYGSHGGTFGVTELVWESLMSRVLDFPGYVELLEAAYPEVLPEHFTFAHVGNAIAAFESRAFDRTDSPFDRFMNGDDEALTPAQIAGGFEFLKAGCAECHNGPMLADEEFHNTGLPQIGPGIDIFSILPTVSESGPSADLGRASATGRIEDVFEFRTASLLNVTLTGPWGHAGQFERLEDFVAHYEDPELSNATYDIVTNTHDPELVDLVVGNSAVVLATIDERLAEPRDFDVDAIVEFLGALTDYRADQLGDVIPKSVPSGLPIF